MDINVSNISTARTNRDQRVNICTVCSIPYFQDAEIIVVDQKQLCLQECSIKKEILYYFKKLIVPLQDNVAKSNVLSTCRVPKNKLSKMKSKNPLVNVTNNNNFDIHENCFFGECDIDFNLFEQSLKLFRPLSNEFKQKQFLLRQPRKERAGYVHNLQQLNDMLSDLKNNSEIAIDLKIYETEESNQSFIWLLQISTRSMNYIVNALSLKTHLHRLNKVFVNRKIIKIFYLACEQMRRLESEFCLYIINMFDLQEAVVKIRDLQNANNQYQILIQNMEEFYPHLHNHTAYFFFFKDILIDFILSDLKSGVRCLNEIYENCTYFCRSVYSMKKERIFFQDLFQVPKKNETAPTDGRTNLQKKEKEKKSKANFKKPLGRKTYSDQLRGQAIISKPNRSTPPLNDNVIQITGFFKNSKVQLIPFNKFTNTKNSLNSNEKYYETNVNLCSLIKVNYMTQSQKNFKKPKRKKSKKTKTNNCLYSVQNFNMNTFSFTEINNEEQSKTMSKNKNKKWTMRPTMEWKLHLKGNNGIVPPTELINYKINLKNFVTPEYQLSMIEINDSETSVQNFPSFMISNVVELNTLINHLRTCRELAVDVKFSFTRSYYGFTCLLQLSTRHANYFINAIKLRAKLHILNEIFANPNILKVFYKSSKKILWLQKDLCLYTINMFDVLKAMNVVDFSLRNFPYFKEINRESYDWRYQPLRKKIINIIVNETQHLLHMKDVLSNELIRRSPPGRNLLKSFYTYCKTVCNRFNFKHSFNYNAYKGVPISIKCMFLGQTIRLNVIRSLTKWRVEKARKLNENLNYILKNSDILQLGSKLPYKRNDILSNISNTLVSKNYVSEISKIISKCRNTHLVVYDKSYPKYGPSSEFLN